MFVWSLTTLGLVGCAPGQEIYYSTHRFFLSERSMYLAVFNLVAPNQSNIEYWY